MRLKRLAFMLLAFYFVFVGGSAYYSLIFPVRIFHHVFVTLLLAGWLLSRIRRRKGIPYTPLNKPLYVMVIVWILSALTSIDPRMAFENLWFQLIHVLFFFALVDLIQHGHQRLVMETQFMLAALVVFVSGLELASWYFGLGIIPGTSIGWIDVIGPGAWLPLKPLRLSLAMNISTLLAGYVAPLIPLTIGWALTARHRDHRTVLRILVVLLGVVLVLTFSRGGILAVMAGVSALAVMRLAQSQHLTRYISPRFFIGLTLIGAVVAMLLFVSLTLSPSRARGDQGRIDMWESALEITRDHPAFGVGAGLYGRAFRNYRNPSIVQDKLASAHNLYLNIGAETGIAGIAVSLWLGILFIKTWWQNWKTTTSPAQRLRLEATLAALIGLTVHSMVDVFTTTPLVLVILLLAAYCIVGHRTRWDTPPPGQQLPAIIALVMLLAYGIWFIQLDRAQMHYQRSLAGDKNALTEAQAALAIDPGMGLYKLQIAYLTGQQVINNPNADLAVAITAYEQVLEHDPTWDTGWINLAELNVQQNNIDQALEYLDRATQINNFNDAALHWSRLAEENNVTDDEQITRGYQRGIIHSLQNNYLPLAEFWHETDIRLEVAQTYPKDMPLDRRYRILAAHDPDRIYTLVSETPQTAPEWWVNGEYALSVENDPKKAISAFTKAIELDISNGDYYVSRARAQLSIDPAGSQRDLNIAQLLGTHYEYPNAIRALFAESPDEVQNLRASAPPQRNVGQEYTAVLYGRPAYFDTFPAMHSPGPGYAALQPWYAIAEQHLANGRIEDAINVYHAILDYTPYEETARQKLAELTGEEN